ncbi:hypothetical protein [Piscinibacter sp.]|nr:hypothetical protein [Albitalea sp.]HUG23728.1 hypothetical protein [Albitalea sp.]
MADRFDRMTERELAELDALLVTGLFGESFLWVLLAQKPLEHDVDVQR